MNRQDLQLIAEQTNIKHKQYKHKVCVCCGAGCIFSGSKKILQNLQDTVKAQGKKKDIEVVPTGCMGPCNEGPLIKMMPQNTIYQKVKNEMVPAILQSHIIENKPIEKWLLFKNSKQKPFINSLQAPFFKKQRKIVLKDCGDINPESIEDYIVSGGYKALERVLFEMSSEEVIAQIKQSRLRGRGGAGFPTGIKWETVNKYVADQKYVICNGDEGDPGAFMDRSVLEGNPHRVLEGMIIAGYATGASKGYVYIRGEYPLAIKRFELACQQARKSGLLGLNILGSTFHFEVNIRIGAGAYVCGEETALIASIEGKRGNPRPRPPFPAEVGLWGKPTLINNVETLACVASIITHGGEWYAQIGTPKSGGTKVFSLAGKINYSGLIEVPMGTSLREIVFNIGGGIPGGQKFKAAQTGGPSGGCIPAEHLDVKMDYENLVALGSIMGSGGLIVMDETSDMVDVARFFMEFCVDESCGKCVPCRVGTKVLYDILTKICQRQASMKDLEKLEELALFVKATSLCGLGMAAPNPLLSTLRYFKNEYLNYVNLQAALQPS